jgi:hypothetical protein
MSFRAINSLKLLVGDSKLVEKDMERSSKINIIPLAPPIEGFP